MKVRATKLGYYDLKRRKEGEVFEISDTTTFDEKKDKDVDVSAESLFSPKWMEKVDEDIPVQRHKKVKTEKARPETKTSGTDGVL